MGRNVTFLQQLLEEVGNLDGAQVGIEYEYGVFGSTTADAVVDFMLENDVFADADSNNVNRDVWQALCRVSEEKSGVVVGGEREWLSELKIPAWLDNTLWETRYATYDDPDGDGWQKGVTVSASINVREKGMVSQALDMVGFVER